MVIDWTEEFDRFWLRLEAEAEKGDPDSRRRIALLDAEIAQLQALEAVPIDDEPWLKRIRQSGAYQLWRLSHPYEPGIAVRVVAWFPEPNRAVALLVSGRDKARIGDGWYDNLAPMADSAIRRYLRAWAGNPGRTDPGREMESEVKKKEEEDVTMKDEGAGTVGPKKVQERLAKVRANQEHQAEVAEIRWRMDAETRDYRIGLSAVRKAAELSQLELATRMSSTQPRVSEAENNKDMLLSTLANYLAAAGATDAAVQVTINGQRIELPLALGG